MKTFNISKFVATIAAALTIFVALGFNSLRPVLAYEFLELQEEVVDIRIHNTVEDIREFNRERYIILDKIQEYKKAGTLVPQIYTEELLRVENDLEIYNDKKMSLQARKENF